VNLTDNTLANAEYIIDQIKTKLRMASGAALSATQFDLDLYEDLKDIYDLVQSKPYFSVSEMDAIVLELGRLRKKTT
jgi:uncharacterized protein YfkK (UPF0435 family)